VPNQHQKLATDNMLYNVQYQSKCTGPNEWQWSNNLSHSLYLDIQYGQTRQL